METPEKPSRTKDKKIKVKGERKRIIQPLSSDDEDYTFNTDDRKRKAAHSSNKLSRAEKANK